MANKVAMTMRAIAVGLVLIAALADSAGSHALGYYALVGAVPAAAVAALLAFGDLLDGPAATTYDRGQAVLAGLALPFLLVATAVRAPLLSDGDVPALGVTATAICLVIFATQALLAGIAHVPGLRVSLRGR